MGGEEEEVCNTGLSLGIDSSNDFYTHKKRTRVQFHVLFPPKSGVDEEDEEDKQESTRKKLKLTKEQSNLLEDSFREHQTLNLAQKQELAEKLKLKPRQVEVWFQNRRARNKLKQTEVECERLLKWCEGLSAENRRLSRELQELRAARAAELLKKENPATAAGVCKSCQQTVSNDGGSSVVLC